MAEAWPRSARTGGPSRSPPRRVFLLDARIPVRSGTTTSCSARSPWRSRPASRSPRPTTSCSRCVRPSRPGPSNVGSRPTSRRASSRLSAPAARAARITPAHRRRPGRRAAAARAQHPRRRPAAPRCPGGETPSGRDSSGRHRTGPRRAGGAGAVDSRSPRSSPCRSGLPATPRGARGRRRPCARSLRSPIPVTDPGPPPPLSHRPRSRLTSAASRRSRTRRNTPGPRDAVRMSDRGGEWGRVATMARLRRALPRGAGLVNMSDRIYVFRGSPRWSPPREPTVLRGRGPGDALEVARSPAPHAWLDAGWPWCLHGRDPGPFLPDGIRFDPVRPPRSAFTRARVFDPRRDCPSRRREPIGWLLLVASGLWAITVLAAGYATFAVSHGTTDSQLSIRADSSPGMAVRPGPVPSRSCRCSCCSPTVGR